MRGEMENRKWRMEKVNGEWGAEERGNGEQVNGERGNGERGNRERGMENEE